MLGYYIDLAARSFRRDRVITTLMVLALALGIGACITTLTVLRLLSGDPVPQRSGQLFYAQLDPRTRDGYVAGETRPPDIMAYADAMYLLKAHRASRQTALALFKAKIVQPEVKARPFYGDGVMVTSDFFSMFDVPFKYGGGWTEQDDTAATKSVVIASFLNDKLFGGANSVGRTLRVDGHDFRVIGVLGAWAPQPRFYAMGLGGRRYGDGDGLFMPISAARAIDLGAKNLNCFGPVNDLRKLESEPCMWLGFWAELKDATAVKAYREFLDGYARQQVAIGRFQRKDSALSDLMAWLAIEQAVPDDARLQVHLAFGFLLICVVNTVGLLLAKCLRRSGEIGVRRAMGASRWAVFGQFMVEAGMVGLAGGVLGLVFAELGLWAVRQQPSDYAKLAYLDLRMFLVTFAVALLASLMAGILPAWRACALSPAPQLKSA